MDNILIKNDWLEISRSKGFSFKYKKAGYFDERPCLNFYLTSMVALLVLVPVGISFGLPWWYWILTIAVFLMGYLQVFLKLPFHTGIVEFEPPEWGWYYYERAIWVCHGKDITSYYMPWSWKFIRRSILLEDESWLTIKANERGYYTYEELEKLKWQEEYPYTYERKDGTIQRTTATVSVEEREWRWIMFQWAPISPFQRVRRTIDVKFSDPIGEGVDTWKGGVYGTGYNLEEDQTPEEALREMEANLKFRR